MRISPPFLQDGTGTRCADGDAQLRTLQRRMKERRGVMAKKLAYNAPDESAPERAGR